MSFHISRVKLFTLTFLMGIASSAWAVDCSCTATLKGSAGDESLYLRWWAPSRLGRGARSGTISSSVTLTGGSSCDPATKNLTVFRGYSSGILGLGGTDYGQGVGNDTDGSWTEISRVDANTIKIPVVRSGAHNLRRPRSGEKTDDYVALVCRDTRGLSRARGREGDFLVHARPATPEATQPVHSVSDPTL